MAKCDQELCPNWGGDGRVCNCALLDLTEEGRRLASWREDLIAQGADPTELEIPLAPGGPAPGEEVPDA